MSHDEEELCQSCGQAVIPQMDGKVYKERRVAGLEILSPRNLLSLSTNSYFYLPVKLALRPKPRTEQPYYSKDPRVAVDEDNGRLGVRVSPA